MKDYSLFNERGNYVLSYKVVNEPAPSKKQKIICKMANGKKLEYEWSRAMELKILDVMKEQIDKASYESRDYSFFALLGLAEFGFSYAAYAANPSDFAAMSSYFGASTWAIAVERILLEKLKEVDFEKLVFYREHKDEINKAIMEGMDYTKNIRRKASSKISEDLKVGFLEPLNPNGLDSYKLKDLESLKHSAYLFEQSKRDNCEEEKRYSYPV